MQKLVSSYKDTMKCDGYKSKMDRYRKKNTMQLLLKEGILSLGLRDVYIFCAGNVFGIFSTRISSSLEISSLTESTTISTQVLVIVIQSCQNVKSFTGTKIFNLDFAPRRVRRSRHFLHFKPRKQNLRGFLWCINLDKLSIQASLSNGSYTCCTNLPKMASFC